VSLTDYDDPEEWDAERGIYRLSARARNLRESLTSARAMGNFMARIKDDKNYYFNNCLDTFNPQLQRMKTRPFLLCMRQEECVEHIGRCVADGIDSMYPKTRKVGESWLHMGFCHHEFMFEDGFQALITSRTNEQIESKGGDDMNALLPKFDFMMRTLPDFLKMKEYWPSAPHKVEMMRKNPLNGAQITGEPCTENFGSGPRASYVLIDEISKCANARAAWTSCGQTAPSRHGVFTPKGKGFSWELTHPEDAMIQLNKRRLPKPEVFRIYYKDIPWFNKFYIFSVEAQYGEQWNDLPSFEAFIADNRHHIIYEGNGYSPQDTIPLGMGYDDGHGAIIRQQMRQPLERMPDRGVSVVYPWRETEGFRYDEVEAAQELEISFDTSRRGLVYSIQMRASVKDSKLVRVPEYPLYCGYDPGRSAGNAFFIFWAQWNWEKSKYEALREFSLEGRTVDYLIPLLTGNSELIHMAELEVLTHDYEQLYEEMLDPMWRPNRIFCDPAISQKSHASKESIKAKLSRYAVPYKTEAVWNYFENRIPAARRIFRNFEFHPQYCAKLIASLEQIYFPEESENTNSVTEKTGYVHHPIYSHGCAAFEYLAQGNPHRYDLPSELTVAPEQRVTTQEQFQQLQKQHLYDKLGLSNKREFSDKATGRHSYASSDMKRGGW
jgi:hypothetical protein